jgi:hypothetical protein
VAVFLSLFAWATYSFFHNRFSVLWPLKLLRSIGTVSASVAFIPLFQVLMSSYQCGTASAPFWTALGFSCFGGAHLGHVIVATVLVLFFVALCSLFALTFFEPSQLSLSLSAKAHGRMDFLFLVIKTLLVCVVEIWGHELPAWALIGALLTASVIWSGSYIMCMVRERERERVGLQSLSAQEGDAGGSLHAGLQSLASPVLASPLPSPPFLLSSSLPSPAALCAPHHEPAAAHALLQLCVGHLVRSAQPGLPQL